MNPKPIEQAHDPIMRTALAALKRASDRARLEAARTGTCLVISRGKDWIRIPPVTEIVPPKPGRQRELGL